MSKEQRPRLSVVALVHDGYGRILMGRRRNGPAKGKFVMPGGGVEIGESVEQALKREVKEETGLLVKVDTSAPLDVAELVGKKAHRVCLIYRADQVDNVSPKKTTDELEDVAFYATNDADAIRDMQEWTRASLLRMGLLT